MVKALQVPSLNASQGTPLESWFLKINHPTERRAAWVKHTILRPVDGPPVSESWCMVFGPGTARGVKRTTGMNFDWDGHRTSGEVGGIAWDLTFEPVAEPMYVLRPELPLRSKAVSPYPALIAHGTVGDMTVEGWLGMQGHNWQHRYSPSYAWAQVVFGPELIVEAIAGRAPIGRIALPKLGAMVVRRGQRELRFDRVFDRWNLRSRRDDLTWTASFRGMAGEAWLTMNARPEEVACLGYVNPQGDTTYCLNSKLARATLRVNPAGDDAFEVTSEHGGALEFLQREPDPRFTVI